MIMSASPPSLVLSIAYALSVASITCAFQTVPQSLVISEANSLAGDESIFKSSRRRIPTLLFESTRSDNDGQIAAVEVDIYDDNGEEVDARIDWENIEEDINKYDLKDGESEIEEQAKEEEKDDDGKSKNKKLIECSASILLPFSEDVAFDAFSDLTRQPSWCKYLHSVEYIGLVDREDMANNNVPLRKSQWTVGVKGLRFSWTSNDTRIVRPNRIEWESTSGMKNLGIVEFVPMKSSSSSTASTQMNLLFAFVAPRVVSGLFRRSGKIRKYTEDVLLGNMLTDFRDVVMEENNL